MLCLATILVTDWDTYFKGMEYETIDRNGAPVATDQRITTAKGNIKVFKCDFRKFTTTDSDDLSNGAAISIDGDHAMLVDYCIFSGCKSVGKGGAIYFINGQCSIARVCSGECTADNVGQFCYVETKANGINTVNYSSIIKSINELESLICGETLYLKKGGIKLANNNISNNKCSWYSAFRYQPDSNENFIKFCSIASNIVIAKSSIALLKGENDKLIEKCNVILNAVKNNANEGNIFSLSGKLTLKNTCLLSNTAKEFFDTKVGTLKVELYDCTIDKMNINKESDIKKETPPFILGLDLLETAFCSASYDSLPDEGEGPKIEVVPAEGGSKKEKTLINKRKIFKGRFKTVAIQFLLIHL